MVIALWQQSVAVKFKLLSDADNEDPENQDESLLGRATSLIRHRFSTRRTGRYAKVKVSDSNEYGEEEIDLGNGSGSDTKEPGLEKQSTEVQGKTEPPEPETNKVDEETPINSGNDDSSSNSDQKEPDFGKDSSMTNDDNTAENEPEPEPESEVHINETTVEVISIDFTDLDINEKN